MTVSLSKDEFIELMKWSAGDESDVDFTQPGFLDASFDDLGFDSLSQVELIEQLRDRYALSIPDEVVDELTTPTALLGYVLTELGKP